MKTFKILGLLLTYPQQRLYDAADEILGILRGEALLPNNIIKQIERFLRDRAGKDILDSEEEYVDTFDRGRAHCLHLFEHIHGESRARGQAMVDLSQAYGAKGLYIKNNELPDYVPLFMEYLSLCPLKEASGLLGEAIDVVAAIAARLQKRNSPYAVVFEAIEALSAVKPDRVKVENALASAPKDPETLEELDEDWKEAEAFGGDPGADIAASCGDCTAFVTATRIP
ncbi:MAG: nitrate reductase molybdenum cofactor assembly chaperone [Hyphomicrobiales bacterium]